MSTLLNLSAEEIELLESERYTYGDIVIQKRLNAIYLMSTTDLTDIRIAQVVGCHRNALRLWREKCLTDGLSSLYMNNYHKPESVLEQHSPSILAHFDDNPPLSINHAAAMIEELTGIKRCPTQIRQFLLRHGYQWRKQGQIPGKADVQKQRQWLENTLEPCIEQAKKGLCHFFFVIQHISYWVLFFAWFGAGFVYF